MISNDCKICGVALIHPEGPKESELLIVGEVPVADWNTQPVAQGSIAILQQELMRVGIDFNFVRRTALWGHKFIKRDDKDSEHLGFMVSRLMNEMKNKSHVLMLGSENSRIFVNRKISEVNGLEFLHTDSVYIPTGCSVTFSYSPYSAESGNLGEVRLAIQKFAERYNAWRMLRTG